MGPGRDRTCDPWVCIWTHYRQPYGARFDISPIYFHAANGFYDNEKCKQRWDAAFWSISSGSAPFSGLHSADGIVTLFRWQQSSIEDTGPRSAVGNVSGNRCESDCRSRGREFDPGPVPVPPFRWIIQEGLLSATSESMCMKYWLTACSSLPRKKCVVRWTDRPAMTIAVDCWCKATKQTNKSIEDLEPRSGDYSPNVDAVSM